MVPVTNYCGKVVEVFKKELLMRKIWFFILVFIGISMAQAQAGWDPWEDDKLEFRAEETIEAFKQKDPALKKFLDTAYGYVVFPTVGKGGFGIGGAYGRGKVFEKDKPVGSASLKQVSFGFQWGGQAYSEIIFFKNKSALEDFKNENFELGAAASAVALTIGASADADYSDGVAVFTMAKGGLMYEATIAGQKFRYRDDK